MGLYHHHRPQPGAYLRPWRYCGTKNRSLLARAVAGQPMGLMGQIVAFALFRFFDAARSPAPWDWADSPVQRLWLARVAGAFCFDDFVAAFCTLLVIALCGDSSHNPWHHYQK